MAVEAKGMGARKEIEKASVVTAASFLVGCRMNYVHLVVQDPILPLLCMYGKLI